MSEEMIKNMVVVNILDNCKIDIDEHGNPERYHLDKKQFKEAVDTLVKNIMVMRSCMGAAEQLFCGCAKKEPWETETGFIGCVKCNKEIKQN